MTETESTVDTVDPVSVANFQVYRKLLAVYETVTYLQKDKRNEFHKYSYTSESAIKAAIHDAFTKNGLILLPPQVVEISDLEIVSESRKGLLTTIKILLTIADVESGQTVTGAIYGRGADAGDKGVYKAITGGLKSFLTTTFLIATGEDPENDQQQGRQKNQRQAPQGKPAPLKSKDFEMIRAITAFKPRIGEETYYGILNAEHVRHADEIPNKEVGTRIYRRLQEAERLMVSQSDVNGGV